MRRVGGVATTLADLPHELRCVILMHFEDAKEAVRTRRVSRTCFNTSCVRDALWYRITERETPAFRLLPHVKNELTSKNMVHLERALGGCKLCYVIANGTTIVFTFERSFAHMFQFGRTAHIKNYITNPRVSRKHVSLWFPGLHELGNGTLCGVRVEGRNGLRVWRRGVMSELSAGQTTLIKVGDIVELGRQTGIFLYVSYV